MGRITWYPTCKDSAIEDYCNLEIDSIELEFECVYFSALKSLTFEWLITVAGNKPRQKNPFLWLWFISIIFGELIHADFDRRCLSANQRPKQRLLLGQVPCQIDPSTERKKKKLASCGSDQHRQQWQQQKPQQYKFKRVEILIAKRNDCKYFSILLLLFRVAHRPLYLAI